MSDCFVPCWEGGWGQMGMCCPALLSAFSLHCSTCHVLITPQLGSSGDGGLTSLRLGLCVPKPHAFFDPFFFLLLSLPYFTQYCGKKMSTRLKKVVFLPKCRVHLLLIYGLCALPAAFPASPLLLQGSCLLVALSLSAVLSFC